MTRLVPLALAALLALPASAQDPPKKDQIVDLGNIKVNRTKRYLEVDGLVSLDRGLIELFACSPAGKRYESTLVLKCRAAMLQTGLLFLGLKRGSSGRFQGDRIKTKGSPVVLLVRWTDPKTKAVKRYLAEDLIWNQRTRASMKRVGWIFVGSRFVKDGRTRREVFMASVTGSLIVTYHDPDAILDTPHRAGSDDTTFYANHFLLPKRGTPINLKIYPKEVYDKLPAAQKAMPVPKLQGAGSGSGEKPGAGSGEKPGAGSGEKPGAGSGEKPAGTKDQ